MLVLLAVQGIQHQALVLRHVLVSLQDSLQESLQGILQDGQQDSLQDSQHPNQHILFAVKLLGAHMDTIAVVTNCACLVPLDFGV